MRRNAKATPEDRVLSDDPVMDRIVMPFVDNLRVMGIDASYNRIDNAQFTLRRRERDFDMISSGYRTSLQPSTGCISSTAARRPPTACSTPPASTARISRP